MAAAPLQQLSLSLGVLLGAALVGATAHWHGGDAAHLAARDFSPAFVCVGLVTMLSLLWFTRLGADAGAELRGK